MKQVNKRESMYALLVAVAVMAMVACTSDEWFELENQDETIDCYGTRADIDYKYLDIKESSIQKFTKEDWDNIIEASARLTINVKKNGLYSILESNGREVNISEKLFSIVKQFYDNSNNILAQKTKRIRRLKRSSPEQIIPTGGTQTDCVGEAIAYYYNLDINVVNDSLSRVFPCYADSGIHRNNLLRAVQLFNSTASSQNCFTETTPVNETSIYGIAEIPGHAVNTIAIVKVAGHYRLTLLDSKNSICYCFDIKSNTVPALDYFDNYPLIPQYIK